VWIGWTFIWNRREGIMADDKGKGKVRKNKDGTVVIDLSDKFLEPLGPRPKDKKKPRTTRRAKR
jgi:hypothetical protein